MAITILLACILLIMTILLCGLLYAFLKIRQISRSAVSFCTSLDEKQPSQLACVVEAASSMIGRSVVASLKAYLIGAKGNEAREANGVVRESIDASPLGGLVSMLPKKAISSLVKNPQLLDMAMNLFSKPGTGGGGGNGGNGSSASPRARFNL